MHTPEAATRAAAVAPAAAVVIMGERAGWVVWVDLAVQLEVAAQRAAVARRVGWAVRLAVAAAEAVAEPG